MKIEVQNKYGYTELITEADNVKIEFTVSEGLYGLDGEGKKDYKQRLGDDITDEGLEILARPLEDLIYYRKRDFDSSDLIKQLFNKLPQEKVQEVLKELNDSYGDI